MVTVKRSRIDRISFAAGFALIFGVAAALLVIGTPVALFERAVMATGIPQLLAIASPPLGLKARILAIIVSFLAVAAGSWLVFRPFERWLERGRRRRTPWSDGGYARADSAVSSVDQRRKPIFAPDELGAPLMSDEALTTVPPPLDLPPELAAPITEDELMLTNAEAPFALAPEPAPEPALMPAPEPFVPTTPRDGETSIHALIRRLEAGLARRGNPDPDPGSASSAPPSATLSSQDKAASARRRRDDEAGDAFSQLRRLAHR